MCVIEIPEQVMQQAGFKDAREALVEFACRLFDAERITFRAALELTGLSEPQLLEELAVRKIRVYTLTPDELREQVETIERLGI